MGSENYGRVIYLVLLLAVVGGSFLISNRQSMGKVAQQASIWGLIFAGMAAAYGLWSDIRGPVPRQAVVTEAGQLEVPMAADGHFYLTMEINGKPVEFMVDTGASEVVLTQQDAARVGVETGALAYVGQANTANGVVRTARVRLEDVRLAGFDEGGMVAWVNEGAMDISLLGMAYLREFSRMEFVGNRLILTR